MKNLRRCLVRNKPAYFHTWGAKSRIVPPAATMGGHNGGIVATTVAIVEYEDGQVDEVFPQEVQFIGTGENIKPKT